jgi:hypothetical protein
MTRNARITGRRHPGRGSAEPSMIVLTDVDALCAGALASVPCTEALRALTSRGVPVVLVAEQPAAHLRTLQATLGIRQPFIADGGRSLHVPRGYFARYEGEGDWTSVNFVRTGVAYDRAVQLLTLLFWTHRDDGCVVALTDRQESLLRAADVPVIVRNDAIDQDALRSRYPDAYMTEAEGSAGWAEAIVGHAAA